MPDSLKRKKPARACAIVDARGELVYHEPGAFPIYSIAKTFLASAVFASALDPATKVSRWVNKTLLRDGDAITLEHLLLHTSGIRDYFMSASYNTAVEQGTAPWSDEVFAAHTLDQDRLFAPGDDFAYSNPGYWLIKHILELEHQRPWSEILQNLICEPLGLTKTQDKEGIFAEDLPNYPSQWVWPGVILSSPDDVAFFMRSELVTPLLARRQKVPGNHRFWKDPHYAYGLMTEPGEMYGHNGGGPGYTAAAYHFTQKQLTGCMLVNDGEVEDAALDALLALIDTL